MLRRSVKFFILIAGLMLVSGIAISQSDTIPVRDDQANTRIKDIDMTHSFDFGLGLGLDYGGLLGLQFGIAPIKHLTIFGSVGYYMFQAGWNFGMKGLILPKTTEYAVRPYVKAMYGCNSIIAVDGAEEYNQVYKGFTVGLGFEFRFGKTKMNGLDLDLNVPLRSGEFWDDYNTMKNAPNIEVTQAPIPVAFSIGYHHEF
jgi:hypothetical protein